MSVSPLDMDESSGPELIKVNSGWTNEKYVPIVLLILGGVYCSLLLLSELLPFVDLPFHLSVATVVRGYGESSNQFSDYFSLQMAGQPNVLYIWFCSAPVFPSVEFANKVYFALYTFMLPFSVFALIRTLGGNTWFSVLSFLYIYNFNTHWGFVGFVGAMPAVFFLFTTLVLHLRAPSWKTRAAIAVGSFLLFFIHVLAAVFFLLTYWLTCLFDKRLTVRGTVASVALTLPLISLIGWWWLGTESSGEQSLVEFLSSYYSNLYVGSLYVRSFFFIFDNSYLAGQHAGLVFGGLIALVSVLFIGWALIMEKAAIVAAVKNPEHQPALIFAGAAAGCFWLLPEGLPGQWALNQRFSVYSVLGLIVLSSVIDLKRMPREWVVGIIAAACVMHAVLYADYFRDFGIETAGFTDEILPEAEGNRLAGLILKPHFRGTLSYLHFSNYYIVRKQGIAVSRMVDFRFGTVRRKFEDGRLPEAKMRFDMAPDYSGEYDDIDYLVVRGDLSADMRDSLLNFEEKTRTGDWSLLVRR
jgi:hypothetical protein